MEATSGERAECAAEVHSCIEFNDSRDDNAGGEDIKVATVNITVNEMILGECAESAAEMHPPPPSLPSFGSAECLIQQPQLFQVKGKRLRVI